MSSTIQKGEPSQQKAIFNILFYLIVIIILVPLILPIGFYTIDIISEKTMVYDISNNSNNIVIPEGTIVLDQTDSYNDSAEYIYIPKTLTEIPYNFFDRFTNLKDINYGGTWKEWYEMLGNNQTPNGVTVTYELSLK